VYQSQAAAGTVLARATTVLAHRRATPPARRHCRQASLFGGGPLRIRLKGPTFGTATAPCPITRAPTMGRAERRFRPTNIPARPSGPDCSRYALCARPRRGGTARGQPIRTGPRRRQGQPRTMITPDRGWEEAQPPDLASSPQLSAIQDQLILSSNSMNVPRHTAASVHHLFPR
jgi:hypothetical protein